MVNVGATTVVERSQLGSLGVQLGHGAQAVVHELPSFALSDTQGPLVYKEYPEPISSPNTLRRIVLARFALDQPRRDHLDEISVWPLRVVEDDGVVRGIVMRRVPDAFVDELSLPGTGTRKKSLREIQNLFIPEEKAEWLRRPVPDTAQRLRICRDFAGALSFFHAELSVAFGDINPKNELYRLTEKPTVLFLDCDGVRPAGEVSGTRQLNTPDWVPPNNEPLSQRTDHYKLGLFILRCLSPGPGASARLDPTPASGVLDEDGYRMLEHALGAKPWDRPKARDWYVHLSRVIGEPVDPPVLTEARLAQEWVIRGKPALVHWEAIDAATVEVITSRYVERVDGTTGAGTVRIFPTESDFVQVVARNEHGEDVRTIGPIMVVRPPPEVVVGPPPKVVLSPPPTVDLPVPTPRLDLPPALLMPPHTPALPPVPEVRLPGPPSEALDLVGQSHSPSGSVLPPITPVVPPFDVASLIMDGPRLDLGHTPRKLTLPDFDLPDFDQSIQDAGRHPDDGNVP